MSPELHAGMAAKKRPWLSALEWTAIGVAGAIILAPYLLPELGIGNAKLVLKVMNSLHSTTAAGNGLAGLAAEGLSHVPLLGATIAEGGWLSQALGSIPYAGQVLGTGGWASSVTAGVIGIGGTLGGNWLAEHAQTERGMRWCRLLTDVALVTSSLIALPSLLTGISAGLVFLSAVTVGSAFAGTITTAMSSTLGSVGAATIGTAGASGAFITAARLLTCCMPALPTGFLLAAQKAKQHKSEQAAKLEASVHMEVSLTAPLRQGEAVQGELRLRDAKTGLPIADDDLAVVHEHKLHLMIVDDGLNDYHHRHPMPTGEPGAYRFAFTPKTPNGYQVWTDMTRQGERHNVTAHAELSSPGAATCHADVRVNQQADAAGLHFEWKASPPLRQGQGSVIEIDVTGPGGQPVSDLEPVMGAPAHLVGFSADTRAMMHVHPLDQTAASGKLHFHIAPKEGGPTKFFLQVGEKGQIVTVPFGQQIFPAKQAVKDMPAKRSHEQMIAEAPRGGRAMQS